MMTKVDKEKSKHSEPTDRPEYAGGQLQHEITGLRRLFFSDAYYFLIAATWLQILGVAFGGYVVINLIFAILFVLGGGGINGARPGSFADAFYFSVQTFSTIGYGAMSPATLYAHVLVTIESFIGLIAVAVTTGLIFAKFSRPSARVAHSKVMVVHTRNGVPTLQFRIANERKNEIINARMHVSALIEELTDEGHQMRRFHPLELERDTSPMFAVSWAVIHRLDESSPLYGINAENIHDRMFIIVTSFEGTDSTFLQTVQAIHFYRPSDIHFDAQFVDILDFGGKGGKLVLNHANLSLTEPVERDD